ncbi:MAG: RcnB family protein [Rhodospirillales bacterium]|nr:RcnB family protein [Rhodospirillales bacterium]
MKTSLRPLGAVFAATLAAGLLLAGLLTAPGPAMAGKQISDQEKQIIERYFAKNPGDTSDKAMPKGMDKKLARGGTLPPGIKKTRLPTKLASKLPERPKNEEFVIVDEDVVLIDTATGIILDMLEKSKMR